MGSFMTFLRLVFLLDFFPFFDVGLLDLARRVPVLPLVVFLPVFPGLEERTESNSALAL